MCGQTVYPPASNVYTHITCPECLVGLDAAIANGEASVRPITNVIVWTSQAHEYVSVEMFVRHSTIGFGDGGRYYTREDVDSLHYHTGLSKEEIVKRLKSAQFTADLSQDKGKPEYTFRSGGTFGFGGLR